MKELKTLVAEDEDFLRRIVQIAVQEFLEAEMNEALGAGKSERGNVLGAKKVPLAFTASAYGPAPASASAASRSDLGTANSAPAPPAGKPSSNR